jgi:hypothetical protein
MKTATTRMATVLAIGLLAACGGGDDRPTGRPAGAAPQPVSQPLPQPALAPAFSCTVPPEGVMRVPPPAVMGGQIEGRNDSSFILVSHPVRGTPRAVLLLGPDLPRQTQLTGVVAAIPEQLFCASDGGLFSNGVQTLNGAYFGSQIYLNVEIDPARGAVSGTLRDVGGGDLVQQVSGGPIAGALFDPAAPPDLAAAAGNWALRDAAGLPGTLSLSADGDVALKLDACSYAGTALPVNGLNLLDMKLLAQPGCSLDTNQTQGFVVLLPMADGRLLLMLWGVDNGWGFEVLASGSR